MDEQPQKAGGCKEESGGLGNDADLNVVDPDCFLAAAEGPFPEVNLQVFACAEHGGVIFTANGDPAANSRREKPAVPRTFRRLLAAGYGLSLRLESRPLFTEV